MIGYIQCYSHPSPFFPTADNVETLFTATGGEDGRVDENSTDSIASSSARRFFRRAANSCSCLDTDNE